MQTAKQRIRQTKSIKDKAERLMALRDLAENMANDFIQDMVNLEMEMDYVLERTPQNIKDELGYETVLDVTSDIYEHVSNS